jgi:hypothetical protein
MTQEQKQIKLAEAAGWVEVRAEVDWLPRELTGIYTWPHPTDPEKTKYYISRKPVPDYFNDLNAVHELEKVLNAGQINTYLSKLYEYTKPAKVGANTWEIISVRVAVHATATQRAEAIGLTLNLWEAAK